MLKNEKSKKLDKAKPNKISANSSAIDLNPQLARMNERLVPASANPRLRVESFKNFTFRTKSDEETFTEEMMSALQHKADKHNIPMNVLKVVYHRGILDWNPDVNQEVTEQQWAFSRVNSFVSNGKARELDSDLMPVTTTIPVVEDKLLNAIKLAKSIFSESGESQSSNSDDPSSRFDGTKSLGKIYKRDTPGQGVNIKNLKKQINKK